ncbi:MAG: hypothetical protein RLZZ70_279 [Candidatus Parcubacteria bacterium]|jgi:chromosome segregation ATPase
MAIDREIDTKQRLLDDANQRLQQMTTQESRLRSDLLTAKQKLSDHYQKDIQKEQANISTLQNNITAQQKDIDTLQKKQTKLQQELQELQKVQTAIQIKSGEQQKKRGDLMNKISGIQRDLDQAQKRLDADYARKITDIGRSIDQTKRGIGTLQADLSRAIEKQKTEQAAKFKDATQQYSGRNITLSKAANSNFKPSIATNDNYKPSNGRRAA